MKIIRNVIVMLTVLSASAAYAGNVITDLPPLIISMYEDNPFTRPFHIEGVRPFTCETQPAASGLPVIDITFVNTGVEETGGQKWEMKIGTKQNQHGGPFHFDVILRDSDGHYSTVEMKVTVIPANDPPALHVPEDQVNNNLTMTGISITDEDVNEGNGKVEVTLSCAKGALKLNRTDGLTFTSGASETGSMTFNGLLADVNAAIGEIVYIRGGNFDGADKMDILVSDMGNTGFPFDKPQTARGYVNITYQIKENPLVLIDGNYTINEDTSVTISFIEDPGAAPLTILIASNPVHGVIVPDNVKGTVRYTPPDNYSGSDEFQIKLTDGSKESNIGTYTITVMPVNDAPTAENMSVSTQQNVPVTGTLAGKDIDNDPLTYEIVMNGAYGNAALTSSSEGSFVYTPQQDFKGIDVFTYQVSDGRLVSNFATVTVNVGTLNRAPLAQNATYAGYAGKLTASDPDGNTITYAVYSEPSKGTVSVDAATGSFVYAPGAAFDGIDSFMFRARDHEVFSNIATATIQIVREAPVADAGPDQMNVTEGSAVTLDATKSYDKHGGALTYQWTQTTPGVQIILSDPAAAKPVFVTPSVTPGGLTVTFQVTVRNAAGQQDTDDVTVRINDNGIAGMPDTAISFKSATGRNIGMEIGGNGAFTRIAAIDPAVIADFVNRPSDLIYGLVEFDIRVPNPGNGITVAMYLDSVAGTDYSWFKYSGGWKNYGQNVNFSADRRVVILNLTDGQPGDDDGVANGVIHVTPSGIGKAVSAPSDNGSDGDDSSGCFISACSLAR